MSVRMLCAVTLFAFVLFPSVAHGQNVAHGEDSGKVWELFPGQRYQDVLPLLRPGDTLLLHEGVYEGSAIINVSGTPEKPITIRGYGQGESRPILRYEGSSANHWEIRGSHLVVRYLTFESTNVYSIRIRGANVATPARDITIADNIFRYCGGGCVSANHNGYMYRNIRILNNIVLDAEKTPFYIGNHDGTTDVRGFHFEGNVVDGRKIFGNVVGYGIELKLNVRESVIRNNYILGTKGPGIMTYGMENAQPGDASLVEGNIVVGSRESNNILIGAGPAVVRDNLAIAGNYDGIRVYDYGGRGLTHGVQVVRNTSVMNKGSDFSFDRALSMSQNIRIAENIAHFTEGAAPYSGLLDGEDHVVEENSEFEVTDQIKEEVERLLDLVPDPASLTGVWSMLSQSPLSSEELLTLLKKIQPLQE